MTISKMKVNVIEKTTLLDLEDEQHILSKFELYQ